MILADWLQCQHSDHETRVKHDTLLTQALLFILGRGKLSEAILTEGVSIQTFNKNVKSKLETMSGE